jgi:hypothetical protein
MTEHTQGPWKAFSLNGIISVMKGGKEVVHWSGFDAADFKRQREANARLIAAAPDMLAALKAFIADYENTAQTCHNGYTAEKARSAIAKAEGTTPEIPWDLQTR